MFKAEQCRFPWRHAKRVHQKFWAGKKKIQRSSTENAVVLQYAQCLFFGPALSKNLAARKLLKYWLSGSLAFWL